MQTSNHKIPSRNPGVVNTLKMSFVVPVEVTAAFPISTRIMEEITNPIAANTIRASITTSLLFCAIYIRLFRVLFSDIQRFGKKVSIYLLRRRIEYRLILLIGTFSVRV